MCIRDSVCAMAVAFPDGRIRTCRGTIEGVIDYKEKGTNGFGYDPIVYVPEYGMTTGEMEPELKNSISPVSYTHLDVYKRQKVLS